MKQILFSFVLLSLLVTNNILAQNDDHDPYQNRGIWKIYNNDWQHPGVVPPDYSWNNTDDWFGTQSTPTGYEKAEWGLADINNYRATRGLDPLDATIIEGKPENATPVLFYCISLFFVALLIVTVFFLYLYYRAMLRIENKKQSKQDITKEAYLRKQIFADFWSDWTEPRRRNNIGHFVNEIGREPKEQEIVTGEINYET
jgi:hypothetical protein